MIQPMNPNRKHEQRRKEKCAMYTIHAIAAAVLLDGDGKLADVMPSPPSA